VAHDGEPGQGHPALRGPERQREDHDEQPERGGGRDRERDEEPAPCWSGELASEASTPVRNVVTLPGIARSATAVSFVWSIAEPVARSRLGAGAPAGPGSRAAA
jgi:hypothetical protein